MDITKEVQDAITKAFEGLEGKFSTPEQVKAAIEKSLEGRFDNVATKEDIKKEIESFSKKATEEIKGMIEKSQSEVKPKTLQEEITEKLLSLDPSIKDVASLKAFLEKSGTKTLAIKAITAIPSTANTDYIGRTNLDTNVNWTPIRKPAFLGRFRSVTEDSASSRFGYTEGSYTGAAGYVGEGVGNANSDSASASAAFMDYAKVQAVQSVNEEVYEDIPDFAAGLITQMQLAAQKFVDDEAYTGDGLAPAGVQHIKGLLTYATAAAFGAGGNMAAYAASVKAANIKNLADAVKSYIDNLDGNHVADLCFMNPVDYFKMSQLKDTTNQPLFTFNAMGAPMLGGLEVVTTAKVAANTMLIMDSMVAEWRTKRSMTLKVGQILKDDIINDKRSAVLSARYQLLVRNLDKVAVIKVTDVAAAITAITAA